MGGWRSLEGGLLHKALRDPTKAADQHALLQLLSQALGIAGGGGGEADKFDPRLLQEMEVSHAPGLCSTKFTLLFMYKVLYRC